MKEKIEHVLVGSGLAALIAGTGDFIAESDTFGEPWNLIIAAIGASVLSWARAEQAKVDGHDV